MKLRIRGNSVRFRLSQTEMEQLEDTGAVQDTTDFGSEIQLAYGLEVGLQDRLEVGYSAGRIRVLVPKTMVQRWAQTDEVALQGEKELASGGQLEILLEKDFACLTPRDGDEDTDTFPNPAAVGDEEDPS
jgi:hypothetical protein